MCTECNECNREVETSLEQAVQTLQPAISRVLRVLLGFCGFEPQNPCFWCLSTRRDVLAEFYKPKASPWVVGTTDESISQQIVQNKDDLESRVL